MADTTTTEVASEPQEPLQKASTTTATEDARNNEVEGVQTPPTTTATATTTESATKDGENAKGEEGEAAENEPPATPTRSNDKDVANSEQQGDNNDKVEVTSNETEEEEKPQVDNNPQAPLPIVSSSKKSRPPYKYDPDKITLRFLFANRDGLTVTVECRPGDTVGEVKGALLSVWPEDLPDCSGGDRLRLVCMGKGILMPDTRTLEDFQIPVFKTHPTPVNVSVKPETDPLEAPKSGSDGTSRRTNATGGASGDDGVQSDQGCACVLL